MKKLYSPENIHLLRNRARKATIAAAVVLALVLIGCMALCFGIRTRNADTRRLIAIVLSALGGWIIIGLMEGVRVPCLREASHEEGVLSHVPESHQGVILSLEKAVAIPQSIVFLPVSLLEGDQKISLKLNTRHQKVFPSPGQFVTVETRRGYITAWEGETHG